MVNESVSFGLALLGTVVGLVIMLYGVMLTAGLAMNTFMIVGGVIVLGAIGLHTAALMSLDSSHGAA
jgi:hypothetical protein